MRAIEPSLRSVPSLGLSYAYEFATYEETAPWFPEERKEDRHRFAAELDVDLSEAAFEDLGLAAR